MSLSEESLPLALEDQERVCAVGTPVTLHPGGGIQSTWLDGLGVIGGLDSPPQLDTFWH